MVRNLALLAALAPLVSATRNHAHEIVRGGAWLYHEGAGPCGSDESRARCLFTDPNATNSRKLIGLGDEPAEVSTFVSVALTLSGTSIRHLDPLTVSVSFTDFEPTSKDWVGAYCIEDEAKPVGDREYLDYQYVQSGTPTYQFGPLVNMRCSWQFRYFTQQGNDAYVKLATSSYVRFAQGKQEPLHVHAAKTTNPSEMRIMWVSGATDKPTVEYGTSASALSNKVTGTGDSYKASDMCEAPSTTVSATQFRDPGVMYSAVMTSLTPESTYYYRVCSGSPGPCSKTFKLKTPPAPGAQKGVASFFVYGDMGDWNIHATGPLPVKRSSTTMQLIRRDMNDPNANYVAAMHVGDLSYAMGKTYLWDQFGALIEPVAAEIPYMVGIGNHEYCHNSGGEKDPSGAPGNGFHPAEGNYGSDSRGECGVPTNKRFLMPANGNNVFWWSTEMGLVHHTMISSEHDYTPGSPMYQWLVKDLESVDRTKTPWLFLHLHRPMYTSEAYDSDHKVALYIRKNIEDLLGKYKVDAVFSGHYHAYELTCPVYMDECLSEPLGRGLQKAKAPVHIMVGSAGADIDDVGYYDVPWSVDAQLEYGYGRVHVHNASHAKFEFVRNRDEIVASSTWIISDHNWAVSGDNTLRFATSGGVRCDSASFYGWKSLLLALVVIAYGSC